MKKLISVLVSAVILLSMAILPINSIAESSYSALTSSASNKWYINGTNTKANIEKYNMRATKDYMVAKGYTFKEAGQYDFSGSLLLDEDTVSGIKEGADAVGFMIIERKSNTVLYPSGKSDFYTVKNTELERTAIKNVTGIINAKAGDEIIFLVKNKTDKTPALQVIFDIYKGVGDKREKIASSYADYTTVQGKNGWKYYKTAVSGFEMPSVPADATPAETNGFRDLGFYDGTWWWVNSLSASDPASDYAGIRVGPHTMCTTNDYLTAKGYTVQKDGYLDFSGTVLLDITAAMGVPENVDTIGFMVIEKRSNTILYPADTSNFEVFKNTEKNRTTPSTFAGGYEAKAGDEILFISKNLTKGLNPSVQIIANVYQTVDGEKKLVGNSSDDYADKQGKTNWRYCYASTSTFKTPTIPAKDIFDAAEHYNVDDKSWYLSEGSVKESALKSYGAKLSKDKFTVTNQQYLAIGIKGEQNGNVAVKGSVKNVSSAGEIGVAVVKKSNFEKIYPTKEAYQKVAAGKSIDISATVSAVKGEEYLVVLSNPSSEATVEGEIAIKFGNTEYASAFSNKQNEKGIKYYMSPASKVCTYLFKTEYTNSPYVADDSAGKKDVRFEPYMLTNFDDEKWMWYVDDWENPASKGHMALLMETTAASTPNYSMVRSYTAQEDCTLSIYGNLNSEDIGDWLGGNPKGKLFDIMIFNDKGQILFPTDRSGFYTFEAGTFNAEDAVIVNVSADMNAGEKVYMVTRNRSEVPYFWTYMYFQIFETPVGGVLGTPITSTNEGFSDMQGDNGWNYYYTTNDSYSFVSSTSEIKFTPYKESASSNKKPTSNNDDDVEIVPKAPWLKPAFFSLVGLDVLLASVIVAFVLIKTVRYRKLKI